MTAICDHFCIKIWGLLVLLHHSVVLLVVEGLDLNPNDRVTAGASNMPPGAKFSIDTDLSVNEVQHTLFWTPSIRVVSPGDTTKTFATRIQLSVDRRQTRNRIIAVAAHIQIIGLFVPTAIAALSPLDCTKQPSGEITLDASPDMLCSAEEEGYSTLAALSPFLFILFAVKKHVQKVSKF